MATLPPDDANPREAESAAFAQHFAHALAQRSDVGAPAAQAHALASAASTLLARRWAASQAADARRVGQRRVHYLSMEFLMGRAQSNALAALGLAQALPAEQLALAGEAEPDAALGNGGLGRLAACFLDAMATRGLPAFGYGLRYAYGMFAQQIEQGQQAERADDWLRHGDPWALERAELRYPVGFSGRVLDEGGRRRWLPDDEVQACAVDFIVPGHGTQAVATLRQWRAEATQPLDYARFSSGDHAGAARHLHAAEALHCVLYPDDSTEAGRELRLRQEYLLVSASLQDMLARHQREFGDVGSFGRHNAVHLNDTHPALAPAELMRLLVDAHGMAWDAAWQVVQQAVSYTNHTLMPEALETWPLALFGRLLPRHLEIVRELDTRLLAEVRQRWPQDEERAARLSLLQHEGEPRVRMAALAVLASRRVNGVSALHSKLMVDTLFRDHAAMWPDRFLNITNGITPRRWLMQAHPDLAAWIDQRLGLGWRQDLNQLAGLAASADDPAAGRELMALKHRAKQRLAALIQRQLGMEVSADAMFDVQIKRFHEYKRQLLNLLQVVARYQAIVADPTRRWQPRVVIFAGKAASAYVAAKQVIHLIHDVAAVINADARVGDRLKLVFLPNYGVSLAEAIIPAADLSEQISTAGTEASGTGNMKLALNGACTIGTWDGANIEMAQAMGEDQMFVFGLRADGVAALRARGDAPQAHGPMDPALAAALQAITDGVFSAGDGGRHAALVRRLLEHDPYLVCADFADYLRAQADVDRLYADPAAWARRALRNIAAMGDFSVDRTIAEYDQQIWNPA